MFKTPQFWYKAATWQSILLYPFSLIIQFIGFIRTKIVKPARLPIPVICIGNIVTGGAGKTPTCIALAKILKTYKNPVFLTKGYGGSIEKPTLVDHQNFTEVGDEPLILASILPTWVAKNRVEGADAAINNGADSLILDDGFQNPGLVKDLSFLVIDGHQGVGNEFILPAGPLRESLDRAMHRADAVVILNEDMHNISQLIKKYDKPLFTGMFHPEKETIERLKDKQIVSFAGLGYPQKFFSMLQKYNLNVVDTVSFPDHYPYTIQDIESLKQRAGSKTLVTTRKDMIKIPQQCRNNIEVIDIELIFDQPKEIEKFVREKII